jgi:ABC-type oligopeptide transport system ATPase subunit
MSAGPITAEISAAPRHSYTEALIDAIPALSSQ